MNAGDRVAAATYRPGYEVVADRIVELIESEGLAPHSRLPTEKQLAQQLGVSHTVTREALKTLAAQGLVTMRRGAGIFVAARRDHPDQVTWGPELLGSLDHMKMMSEYRQFLEPQLARVAAMRATPQQVRELLELVSEGESAAAQSDHDAFASADEQFHRAVAGCTQNTFMIRAQESIIVTRRPLPIAVPRSHPLGAAEHRRIAEAIARGDLNGAADAMEAHVVDSLARYQEEVDRLVLQRRS